MPGLTMNESTSRRKRVAVCGGGLVGCLAACYFAQRDYDVTLYEYRPDIRQMKVVVGRSINMAMSVRGREGLRGIGAEQAITSKGIEMYSRMLHDTKGATNVVPYGKSNECILSIDRRYLNELLLTEAEKSSNIRIEFNHKLLKCDTSSGELVFENLETKQVINEQVDLIVGCDGAFSAVRASLLKDKPVDYSQEYISSYYLELQIPASSKGEFLMPPNHLHIWPRGQFMLIALPNQDCTFTCTLFMPLDMFDQIKTPGDLIAFFQTHFVDSLNLIGKDRLIETYFANKPQPLVSVRCNPHHGKKCVLLGDSAHAMVPFYGQGMNCGFEDCIVFFDLLDKYGSESLDKVLAKYSEIRVPDAHAICDLAIRNYEEMRYLVTTRKYILRKYLDNFLNKLFPNSWIPLYSMVTFSRIRYSEVIEKRKRQDELLGKVAYMSAATTLVAAAALAATLTFRAKLF